MADFKELIRVANTDIAGKKPLYYGLTSIYGVSYSVSHALCYVLHLNRTRKIGSLTETEIKAIEALLAQPDAFPSWLVNRRKDMDTGKHLHMLGPSLRLHQEFDIRRLKKIRSYRGMRHAQGLPVRGQRTRSHFRHGKTVGVMKKAKAQAAGAGK